MEYRKIANLLDNEVALTASNQPSKLRTRNWVEINDKSRGTYTSNNIKFKTTMLRSNSCDYADAYILVNGRITITGAWDDGAARREGERDKGVNFESCAPFTKCVSRINNTDIDTAQDTFFINGNPVFNNGPSNLPKKPPDWIILLICALENFISVDVLLLNAFLIFVFCLAVSNK